jgi:tripartite-type tricarboxylate transporter receptor subunit TctC
MAMERPRRKFLYPIVVTATFAALASASFAQNWPTRPMTVVVPFGAGGAVDVFGRLMAANIAERLGQPAIVENVTGAGGMTAVARVVKAVPDGYQIAVGTSSTAAINQTLYKKPLYNAATELAPVVLVADQPQMLVMRKDLPARSLREFIAYTRANQAKMQYGSTGVGSITHLACEMVHSAIGVTTTHVPYRGGGQVVQDLVAGRIDYYCGSPTTVLPLIEGGSIHAIAVLGRARLPTLPTVATAQELGLSGLVAENWMAFFLPRATPAAIIQRLHEATVATMETPAVQMRLKEIGLAVVAPERRSSQYLQDFVLSEIEKWAFPVKASGVAIN